MKNVTKVANVKDTLHSEKRNNLDGKDTKRSVKMRTTNLYKVFSKNIYVYRNCWLLKFVHYMRIANVIRRMLNLEWYVYPFGTTAP